MLKLLTKYRFPIILALIFTLIELMVELFQPFLIAKIIDDGIVAQNPASIRVWGAVLLAATAVSFVCGILNSFYSAHASQGYGYDLRERLYGKVQQFSHAVFNRLSPSTYITRMTNDVQQVQNTLFMSLRIMVRAPLVVVGSVIMAILVNPRLGFYLIVSAPVLFVLVVWIMRKAGGLFRRVQNQLDRVNATLRENLQAVRLVRAFNREERENGRFARQAGQLSDDTRSALRWSETTMPTVMLVTNAGILAVLWFGGSYIRLGEASVGEVVAVVNYAMRTGGVLSMMSWIIMSFARAKASAERIGEVLEMEDGQPGDQIGSAAGTKDEPEMERMVASPAMKDGQTEESPIGAETGAASEAQTGTEWPDGLDLPAHRGADEAVPDFSLSFRHVSFRYPNASEDALTDISFDAAPGQRIAILGATGSGKSTLVQLIPRLFEPTGGEIRIGGKNLLDWNVHELRGAVGYVPQETLLFTGTVRENIAWGKPDATFSEIEQVAKDAQIHEAILQFPGGYDSLIGQRGINLSGGQKQRIAIARALVRKPNILILDDSTSALDMRTEAALLMALGRYDCTILMITQKVSTAMQADTILLLDNGRVSACGTHGELIASVPLYRKIVESQNGKGAAKGA